MRKREREREGEGEGEGEGERERVRCAGTYNTDYVCVERESAVCRYV